MDEPDREPRPLGWLFATNPQTCPNCGHTHDCPTTEDQ